jgi:hypothetical protein
VEQLLLLSTLQLQATEQTTSPSVSPTLLISNALFRDNIPSSA